MNERIDVVLHRTAIRLFEGGLKRRPVFRYWRELRASERWSEAALEELRVTRLRRLITRAQARSEWYRAEWQSRGLVPEQVRSTTDLVAWPILERETIRQHRVAMRATRPGERLIAKATGGSSGVPLHFDLDLDSNERRMAAWHRGYSWAGAAPGTRQWYLWGIPPTAAGEWKRRKVRLYDRLYRRTTESCFDLSERNLSHFVESLHRSRPDAIVAYTGALHAFARMLEHAGIAPYSPRSIVVGAEKLHGFQRELIERVFRAPVFETYGSREFMLIGAECEEHHGLHLTAEHLVVEVVDDAGEPVAPGVEGDVVITDLTNLGMPFIRYRNGDRAVMADGPCPCGRTLPRLARVVGRRLDVLTTPTGEALPGEFFPHILKDFAAVLRYQVIQERPESITVKLVAPDWSPDDTMRFDSEVASVAGGGLRVELVHVPDIPLTGAGKLQVVVNRLAPARTLDAMPTA